MFDVPPGIGAFGAPVPLRFLGDENMAAHAKSATQMGNSSGNTHNRIQI
jgi:hypothetical protein